MGRSDISDEAFAEAKRQYEAGASLRAVALRLGVPSSTLTRWARDDGWPLRPPPPGAAAASAAAAVVRARKRVARKASVDRAALAAKLRTAVDAELTAAERALGRPGRRGEAERAARTLASLVRTLNELRRLDAGNATAEESDAPYSDLDALRRELARRLGGLGAGGAR